MTRPARAGLPDRERLLSALAVALGAGLLLFAPVTLLATAARLLGWLGDRPRGALLLAGAALAWWAAFVVFHRLATPGLPLLPSKESPPPLPPGADPAVERARKVRALLLSAGLGAAAWVGISLVALALRAAVPGAGSYSLYLLLFAPWLGLGYFVFAYLRLGG